MAKLLLTDVLTIEIFKYMNKEKLSPTNLTVSFYFLTLWQLDFINFALLPWE
jgi:hypothetical protein